MSSAAIPIAKKVAADIAPRADEANRDCRLPAADVAALIDSGYTLLPLPQQYGGFEASLADCLHAQIELAQINPSTALVAGMHLHVMGHNRETRSWDEAHYAELCRIAVAERGLFNAVATEPALGSPSRGQYYQTTAERDGEQLRINGHKTWSTGGEHLTHMLVKLSLDGEPATVIVPQRAPGVRWQYTWQDVLSFRASDSHDVYFEDVRIAANSVLDHGGPNSGPNIWFPMVMSSIYLGAAIGARNTVIRYALERVPTALGRPIATLPKIQRQIGEIDVRVQAAHSLLFDVAAGWPAAASERTRFAARMAAAKVMVTDTAREVTDLALRIAGGISLTTALPLERFFRDVRAGAMQPPSGDSALEMVGRAAIESLRA